MKKRCEICGKIYEVDEHDLYAYRVSVEIDSGDIDREVCYHGCVECAEAVEEFVNKLMHGNTEEPKETDAPKKTGHWSLLYSPIVNTTLMKCSCCEFTIEFDGRINSAYKMPECPNCKAHMEDRADDYSL